MKNFTLALLLIALVAWPVSAQEVVGKAQIKGNATIVGGGGGGSTPTIVGFGVIGSTGSSTSNVSVQNPQGTNISVPSGTLLYVLAGANNTAGSFTITDNCNTGGTSDTFSTLDAFTANGSSSSAQSFTTTTGATVNPCTVTITYSVATEAATGSIYAYSGSSGIDVHHINPQIFPGTGANALTSGSVTTTGTNRLCFGATVGPSSADTLTSGTSTVTWVSDAITGTGTTAGAEHFSLSAAGAITATFTNTTNPNSVPLTSIACAKP